MTTRLVCGSASDVGVVRSENQDRVLTSPGLWLVADGMGGHRGGEVASLVAAEVVASAVADLGPERLDDAVRRANGAVVDRALGDPTLSGMGTTLTALALAPRADGVGVLVLVNVGDSRTYRLGAGSAVIEQLTVDHSLVAEWEREGRITAEQAATHPHRNVITRALGVDDDVEVDRWELTPVVGDRYLLCSDGLTNELDDDAIASVLAATTGPQAAADELVSRANAAGGRDNVSVVVVDVVAANVPPGAGTLPGRETADGVAQVVPAEPAAREVAGTADTSADRLGGRRRGPRSRFTWRVALFITALVVLGGLTVGALAYGARGTYFVGTGGDDGAEVVIFQGRPGGLLWFDPTVVEQTNLEVADLGAPERQRVEAGHVEPTLDDARRYVATLNERVTTTTTTTTTTTPPTTTTTAPAPPEVPAEVPAAAGVRSAEVSVSPGVEGV